MNKKNEWKKIGKADFAYIVLDENAQYYECGFSCDNAAIICVNDERYFMTDSRYVLEAKQYSHASEVIESVNFAQSAQKLIKSLGIKTLVFNPSELTLTFYQQLQNQLSLAKCELQAKDNFHQRLRITKSDEEIALIKHSQMLNKKAFKHFAKYIRELYKKSPSEKQLHYYAMQFLSDFGKYDVSFEPIVGINANGAKPHALPSDKCALKKNDILLFDAGIKYKRFCSDMTRTAQVNSDISFSKKQHFKDSKRQKIYDIVLKAQETCIAKARSGMSGKQIDAIARDVISKSGYGDYFIHSTGHGVGLDIHELPRISKMSDDVISDGMVFSIEPGIYLPDAFGVRIEDLVVMKNGRAEVL